MSRMMVEAEIYVKNTRRCKALTVESDDIYTAMYLDRWQSYEIADEMEAISEGRRHEPFEMEEGLDSLTIEEYGWLKIRMTINGVRGILDRQAVREIAHDLRNGWEGEE